jgi:hypothetical protein
MTNDPTSAQQRDISYTIPNLFVGLISIAVMVVGNNFMIEFIGSHSGQRWLSEYIERHPIWANIIYFAASLGLFSSGEVPFV